MKENLFCEMIYALKVSLSARHHYADSQGLHVHILRPLMHSQLLRRCMTSSFSQAIGLSLLPSCLLLNVSISHTPSLIPSQPRIFAIAVRLSLYT